MGDLRSLTTSLRCLAPMNHSSAADLVLFLERQKLFGVNAAILR